MSLTISCSLTPSLPLYALLHFTFLCSFPLFLFSIPPCPTLIVTPFYALDSLQISTSPTLSTLLCATLYYPYFFTRMKLHPLKIDTLHTSRLSQELEQPHRVFSHECEMGLENRGGNEGIGIANCENERRDKYCYTTTVTKRSLEHISTGGPDILRDPDSRMKRYTTSARIRKKPSPYSGLSQVLHPKSNPSALLGTSSSLTFGGSTTGFETCCILSK